MLKSLFIQTSKYYLNNIFIFLEFLKSFCKDNYICNVQLIAGILEAQTRPSFDFIWRLHIAANR